MSEVVQISVPGPVSAVQVGVPSAVGPITVLTSGAVDAGLASRVTAAEAGIAALETRVDALEASSGAYVFTPQMFGAVGDGVADDTLPLQIAIAMAVATRGMVYLGSGKYRVTAPIGTMITVPITIVGDGLGTCFIIIDPSMVGDLLSFRNVWYGAETVIGMAGTPITGNPTSGLRRGGPANKKNGVHIAGFTVTGDRSTPNEQNGIIFYDRTDGLVMYEVDVEFVRGTGIGLSGHASNPTANRNTLIRESKVDAQTRWCGDRRSARPAVTFNCTSKTPAQAPTPGDPSTILDDTNNYNSIRIRSIFSEGMSFQSICLSYSTAGNTTAHDDDVYVLCDSQMYDYPTSSAAVEGALIAASHWSITAGVLTIASGASLVRINGTAGGTIGLGCYLFHVDVPPGTYIAEFLTGAGGVGTYRLGNRLMDITAWSSDAAGSLRITIPNVERSGGQGGQRYTFICNSSPSRASGNSVAIIENGLPLSINPTGPKTVNCFDSFAIGSIAVGAIFLSVGTQKIEWAGSNFQDVSIIVGNITQSVVVDMGNIQSGRDLSSLTGDLTRLHVIAGGQRVVSALPNATRWPNLELLLLSGGSYTRHVSNGTSWVTL